MAQLRLDRWGYEVKTSSDSCISSLNAYYQQVLSYGRERSVILEATRHDKDCVLANILAAHFLSSSSDPTDAASHLEAAKSRLDQGTSYEKAVYDAVSYLISKDRDDDIAVQLHAKLLKDFPRDLVSLKRVQILCFYMAQPDLSLNLIQEVLHENQQESYVYGMLAFSLLELGLMAEAHEAAKKGNEINKDDCWSHHALCHVLQYECRFKEAVEFMESCSASWNSCSSFMYTHNWWHVALCYLEGNSPMKTVVDVYDNRIWKELEKTDAVPPEVYLNALGLLLRVSVRGEMDAFGDRLNILASCVADKGNWYLEWHLDVLILWALSKTGNYSKAEDLLRGLKSRITRMTKKKQLRMRKAILLAEALYEFGRGNDKHVVELLGPNFDAIDYKIIGASDEQADVFNEVWYTVLLNSGDATKAVEDMKKRVKAREGIPFTWRLLERGYNMSGSLEAAETSKKASALESAYFK